MLRVEKSWLVPLLVLQSPVRPDNLARPDPAPMVSRRILRQVRS